MVNVMPLAQQTLTGTSITSTSTATVMTFEKLLNEANEPSISTSTSTKMVCNVYDDEIRELSINLSTINDQIFAVGSSPTFAYHANRIAVSLNLGTCASAVGMATCGSK
jgi:hypothetical protein